MLLNALRIGRSEPNLLDGAFHGLFLSIAVLTRAIGLLVVPCSLILARPWGREWCGRRLAALATGGLVLIICLGAWIARNR